MAVGLVDSVVFLLALVGIPLFAWTLSAVLATPAQAWMAAGMRQLMWLGVVLVVPLIGSILFLIFGWPRLRTTGDEQAAR